MTADTGADAEEEPKRVYGRPRPDESSEEFAFRLQGQVIDTGDESLLQP